MARPLTVHHYKSGAIGYRMDDDSKEIWWTILTDCNKTIPVESTERYSKLIGRVRCRICLGIKVLGVEAEKQCQERRKAARIAGVPLRRRTRQRLII